jgi:hypothetical protein
MKGSDEKFVQNTTYCKGMNDANKDAVAKLPHGIAVGRNTYTPASTCINDDSGDGGGRLASSAMLSFLLMTSAAGSGSSEDRSSRSSW